MNFKYFDGNSTSPGDGIDHENDDYDNFYGDQWYHEDNDQDNTFYCIGGSTHYIKNKDAYCVKNNIPVKLVRDRLPYGTDIGTGFGICDISLTEKVVQDIKKSPNTYYW
jgi:hypothetical protein